MVWAFLLCGERKEMPFLPTCVKHEGRKGIALSKTTVPPGMPREEPVFNSLSHMAKRWESCRLNHFLIQTTTSSVKRIFAGRKPDS
jgi:hypothetical protein